MSKQHVDLIAGELENMLTIVSDCPEHLQPTVLDNLCSALLRDGQGTSVNGANSRERFTAAIHTEEAIQEQQVHDLEWYGGKFDLISINDMEFAAFVAFYYCEVAETERKESIDVEDLETACDIVGRDIPGSLSDTLYNAKRKRKYLESKAKGKYALTHRGRRYVKNELLKAVRE